jgi:hypothetical protein
MKPQEEQDFQKVFEELRQQDQGLTPTFERVWKASQARQGARTALIRSLRFAVAAALLLVSAFSIYMVSREILPVSRPSQVSLSQWKAPTDFLLRTPGIEILHSIPTFAVHRSKQKHEGVQP